MVAPLKTRGLDDLNNLQARLTRLFGLRRIGPEDYHFIEKRLREVEERIVEMSEKINTGNDPF